jgi:hypothetical protein
VQKANRAPLNLHLVGLALQYSVEAYKYSHASTDIPQGATIRSTIIAERKTSALALVVETADFIIVAFKGSQELLDWSYNLRAIPWRYAGTWAHRGFVKAHASIWPQIHAIIRANPHKQILITGHSLGGALTELSCLFLHDHPADVHAITFGKPNVFLRAANDPDFQRFPYLKTQLSVVAGSDIVARIPRFLFCPDPHQAMLYLANNGQDHVFYRGDTVGDFTVKEYILRDWRASDFVSDHLMPNTYQQRITNYINVHKEAA